MYNLTLHLKVLEKEQQIKPQTSRRQEIIKIRGEINAIETKKTKQTNKNKTTTTTKLVEQINETRSWFFEIINKLDKPQISLIKKKKERTQIKSQVKEERSQPTLQKYKQ